MNLVRAFFFQNQGRGDLPPSPPLTRLLLMGNVAAILPLKYKLSGKCKRFIAINRSTEMLKIVEFSKISIKTKKCKTFSKAQTANCLKKFIQSPPIPYLVQFEYFVLCSFVLYPFDGLLQLICFRMFCFKHSLWKWVLTRLSISLCWRNLVQI